MDRIPEAQKMPFKTWAEGLREEGEVIGEARGEARGKAEGKAEGKSEGKAELVAEMLRNGANWEMISKLTHITSEEFERMKALGK
jgi:predicted transposase YdaD